MTQALNSTTMSRDRKTGVIHLQLLMLIPCALLSGCSTAGKPHLSADRLSGADCEYWQSKVDANMRLMGARLDELPSDVDAPQAIRCLLQLKGQTMASRFGGATRFDVSEVGGATPMDVAALYYMTFIYTRVWDHADAIMIDGPKGVNSRRTVNEAFRAFEAWSKTVDRLGIAEVRVRGLHPLRGTQLHWYGRRPEP